MSSWLNILEGAVLLLGGALLTYLLLWWKDRSAGRARALEAQAILDKARAEAEIIVRDARLTGAEEAKQLREAVEQSFAARRQERAESEKRLSERETLINSQLEKMVEAEKTVNEQKAALKERLAAQDAKEKELSELTKQTREQLRRASGMSEEHAKAEFLKQVECDAREDANNISHCIIEEAKLKAEEKARRIISVAISRYAGEHTFENTTA